MYRFFCRNYFRMTCINARHAAASLWQSELTTYDFTCYLRTTEFCCGAAQFSLVRPSFCRLESRSSARVTAAPASCRSQTAPNGEGGNDGTQYATERAGRNHVVRISRCNRARDDLNTEVPHGEELPPPPQPKSQGGLKQARGAAIRAAPLFFGNRCSNRPILGYFLIA